MGQHKALIPFEVEVFKELTSHLTLSEIGEAMGLNCRKQNVYAIIKRGRVAPRRLANIAARLGWTPEEVGRLMPPVRILPTECEIVLIPGGLIRLNREVYIVVACDRQRDTLTLQKYETHAREAATNGNG